MPDELTDRELLAWALKRYGTRYRLARALGVAPNTMYSASWADGRIPKARRYQLELMRLREGTTG